MRLSPVGNAAIATLYIVLGVYSVNTLGSYFHPAESLLMPMIVLGLFVLSAAVMGFLFLYEPFNLYFEKDQKQQAVIFFLKTVAFFACFVVILVVALLYTSI